MADPPAQAGKRAEEITRSSARPAHGACARPPLAKQGLPIALKTPAEMSAMLPAEVAKWAALIKAAHIAME